MKPLLQALDVEAGYVPGLPIVRGASLSIAAGEIVTILGPNGAGKSTLIKAIAGLVPISSGAVKLDGKDITNTPAHRVPTLGVGYVPQTANVFTTLSVTDNLRVAGHRLGRELGERIDRMFALFPDLAERRRNLGRQLSGGQRQMLALARALISEPRLLMPDEPSAGLAPKMTATVLDRLRRLADSGIAVLMVEQNARAALQVSDRAYVLAEGRNRLEGKATDLVNDDRVRQIYLGAGGGTAP